MSRLPGWVAIGGVLAVVAVGCGGGDVRPTAGSPTPVQTRTVVPVGAVAICPQGNQPDRPGPAAQPRPPLDQRGVSAAVDAQSGVVVVVDDIGGTWTFDVCTNTWAEPATRGASPPEWTRLVYDAASDLTYGFSDADVVAYDVESATWTLVNTRDTELDGASSQNRVVLDPDSRTVYVFNTGNGELNSYDLARNRWAHVEQGMVRPPTGVDGVAAFDTTVGRMVLKVRYNLEGPVSSTGEPLTAPPVPMYGQTWTFHPAAGTWSKIDTYTPEVFFGYWPWGGEMTYDTTSRTSVVFAEGSLAMFDATTSTWTTARPGIGWPPAAPAPGVEGPLVVPQQDGTKQLLPITEGRLARTGHAVVDDVVNGRLLVLGGHVRDADDQPQKGTDAWAYHVASNTWTMVVPARPD